MAGVGVPPTRRAGAGAPWIWNLATAILPKATPIVDIYHAREHLHDSPAGAPARWATVTPTGCKPRLADLNAGDIETLVAQSTRLPLDDDTARDTAKALAYFETNAHRMRYGYFRDHGMFIGSGVVEAGCESVIAQRLKLSGMRWNIPGATSHRLTGPQSKINDIYLQIWRTPVDCGFPRSCLCGRL